MRSMRVWLFLLSLCLVYPATGWINPVIAAEEVGGRGEGFQPEGKEEAKEEGKKEEAKEDECPSTFGPIITDTAIPIEKGKFAIQPTWGLSLVTNTLSPSWRRISAGGDFKSLGMSAKFTYGLWNNLEVYTVIPYIHNWASNVTEPGPNGERSANFGGLGDINLTFKYRLVEEGPVAPTVSAIFAPTFPSGHFQHLNPGRLEMDQLGAGSYNFTTGFNLSKYLKPFIFYANCYYTMATAYNTRGDRSPLVSHENGDLAEGDPVSTLHPDAHLSPGLCDGESGRGVPDHETVGSPGGAYQQLGWRPVIRP
ncbi:MAG: hypothetical protein NTW80_04510 [Deltaproteobacteria bacterium]|nr:hypothetical protein [Deltaproteobacteria bacterium]